MRRAVMRARAELALGGSGDVLSGIMGAQIAERSGLRRAVMRARAELALGGSGDVLSGIMGALIAEKSERTLVLASEIHGLAGTDACGEA